ncbi:GntP family permease [Candidatus Epulonipiscium viviparus]|uniref:GntP family permease n=1 Tax=Candidatus Epulonipiscium viviparus TaxID=420336 RepID=UPI00016C0211|nr:GntP family permease [Candidatus Epulopiscium viviparus]
MNLSLLGIIIAIVVFILLSFRGVATIVSVLVTTIIIALFSGTSVLDTLNGTWLSTVGNFVAGYFLIFALGALFGKLMAESGSAKSIAIGLSKLIDKTKNKKFAAALVVPIFYFLLSYVGISPFVAVFSALAVGKEILQKYDIPWRLFCYGGVMIMPAVMLPGSLQVGNIMAGEMAGTNSLTGGAALGIVATATYIITVLCNIFIEIKMAEKRNEGFIESGRAFVETETAKASTQDENLISWPLAVAPLVAIILFSTIFEVHVIVALTIGIVICGALSFKRLKTKGFNNIVTTGLLSSYVPLLNVAATSAVASVISASSGFAVITEGLSSFSPLVAGSILALVGTFIVCSGVAALRGFGETILANFMAAGLAPGVIQRLITIVTFSSLAPHAAAIANTISLTKIDYKLALKIYIKGSFVGGFSALAVAFICIQFGIFV